MPINIRTGEKDQTFKKFMKQFRKQPNRLGDLADDMAADRNFTRKNTKDGILDYLNSIGACDAAIDVFNDAWNMYNGTPWLNHIEVIYGNEESRK